MLQQFRGTDQYREREVRVCFVKVISVGLTIAEGRGQLFVFRFVFTNAYQNMDGTDTRQEYAYINKKLRKEREHELKVNPPKPKEVKKNKTDEQKEQEIIENEKAKNQDADIFDMYK